MAKGFQMPTFKTKVISETVERGFDRRGSRQFRKLIHLVITASVTKAPPEQ